VRGYVPCTALRSTDYAQTNISASLIKKTKKRVSLRVKAPNYLSLKAHTRPQRHSVGAEAAVVAVSRSISEELQEEVAQRGGACEALQI